MEIIELDRGPPEAWMVFADRLEERGDEIDRAFARIVRSVFGWKTPVAEDVAAVRERWPPRLANCDSEFAQAIAAKLHGTSPLVRFVWFRPSRDGTQFVPVEADRATRAPTVFASVAEAETGAAVLRGCTRDDPRMWILYRLAGHPVASASAGRTALDADAIADPNPQYAEHEMREVVCAIAGRVELRDTPVARAAAARLGTTLARLCIGDASPIVAEIEESLPGAFECVVSGRTRMQAYQVDEAEAAAFRLSQFATHPAEFEIDVDDEQSTFWIGQEDAIDRELAEREIESIVHRFTLLPIEARQRALARLTEVMQTGEHTPAD